MSSRSLTVTEHRLLLGSKLGNSSVYFYLLATIVAKTNETVTKMCIYIVVFPLPTIQCC